MTLLAAVLIVLAWGAVAYAHRPVVQTLAEAERIVAIDRHNACQSGARRNCEPATLTARRWGLHSYRVLVETRRDTFLVTVSGHSGYTYGLPR